MTTLLPSPSPSPSIASSDEVVWRQLRPRLWVGRAEDAHLGMIERGRRFTVTDLEGQARGGYRTLESAQAALTGELPVVSAAAAGTPAAAAEAPRSLPPVALWATGAMAVAVTLSMGALTFLR